MLDLRKQIRRGDVWVCDFTAENGENSNDHIIKKRYGIVVSNDAYNNMSPSYPVVLPLSLSDSMNGTGVTLHIANDTSIVSFVRTNAIQGISKANLLSLRGSVTESKMEEIDNHLLEFFGMDINKYLYHIQDLEARLVDMEEYYTTTINSMTAQESDSLLTEENEKLKDRILELENKLKYRESQFAKFKLPVSDIQQPVVQEETTIVEENKEEAGQDTKSRRRCRSAVTGKIVKASWNVSKCNNFLNFIENNGRSGTMEKYGIVSNATYYAIVNACKTKVYSSKK